MRRLLITACLAILGLTTIGLTACGVGEDGVGLPEILDVRVQPDTISQSEANDGVDFTVEMDVVAFEGDITDADAFIQVEGDNRFSEREDFEIDGNTISLIGVNPTWFRNLPAGEYAIGASVSSDEGEDASQLDLAPVTVTD
ncbi:MAG: hypothetical protein ACLFVJ_20805 [Persicimonas sp.]